MNEEHNNNIVADSFRALVLESAARFKAGWTDLAKLLTEVAEKKSYNEWGFKSFEEYCRLEIRIRKSTAEKLTGAWEFVRKELPERQTEKDFPELDTVDIVRKAKGNPEIKSDDYDKLREMAFEEGLSAKSVAKKYREFDKQILALPDNDELEKSIRLAESLRKTLTDLKADEDVCVACQKIIDYLGRRKMMKKSPDTVEP